MTEVQQIQPGGDKLSDFQKDKFRHFFTHVLDLNSDYVISAEDFDKLNEVRASITRLLTLPKAVGVKCSSNEGIIKNILKTRYIKFTLLTKFLVKRYVLDALLVLSRVSLSESKEIE